MFIYITALSLLLSLEGLTGQSYKPSNKPTKWPTVQPTECRTTHMFVSENGNPLPPCQDQYAPGRILNLCGYFNDGKSLSPANLWNNNMDGENDFGLGIAMVDGHGISSKSFIRIANATDLLDVAFDIHSSFGDTEYIIYASNQELASVYDTGSVTLIKSNAIGSFQPLPEGDRLIGTNLDYRNYKYLFITSGSSTETVLLFEMRYRCVEVA